MESNKNVIHLIAGGTAGTTGAVLTCPLEVVKTRLQSSVSSFVHVNVHSALRLLPSQQVVAISTCAHNCQVVHNDTVLDPRKYRRHNSQIVSCLRHILKTEGVKGLFKGLGPTLVGVAPSRCGGSSSTFISPTSDVTTGSTLHISQSVSTKDLSQTKRVGRACGFVLNMADRAGLGLGIKPTTKCFADSDLTQSLVTLLFIGFFGQMLIIKV